MPGSPDDEWGANGGWCLLWNRAKSLSTPGEDEEGMLQEAVSWGKPVEQREEVRGKMYKKAVTSWGGDSETSNDKVLGRNQTKMTGPAVEVVRETESLQLL